MAGNNQIDAKIRIGAQVGDAVAAVRALGKELSGIGSSARGTGVKDVGDQFRDLGKQLREARNLVAGFFAVQVGGDALRQVTTLLDRYNGMVNRLKAATVSQREFAQALQVTTSLAATYNQNVTDIGRLVERLYSAIKPLGGTVEDARTLTEGLSASLRLSGATAEEAASAILQYSQALGKGVLNGDEFRAVFESAPRLIYALSEALGKSTSELRKMGEEGRLSTSLILDGLNKALPKLRAQAQQIAPTLGEAFTGVNNALTVYLANSQTAQGSIRLLVEALQSLAGSIGPLVEAITALGIAITAVFVGRLAAAATAAVQAAAKQAILAAAARSAAAEMGIAATASTTLASSLAGPVGLIAAVLSLAGAWVTLDKAQRAARLSTIEGLQQERDAVKAQLDELDSASDTEQRLGASKAVREITQRKLQELDQLIRDKEETTLRMSGGPRGGPGLASDPSQLRDPATVEAFERENQTRNTIVQKYAEQRKAYELAKDKDIAAARARNDEAAAKLMEADKLEALKRSQEREDKELRSLAANSTVTRVAQAKQLYDKELQLQIDAAERSRRVAQEQFEAGMLDLDTYFDRRAQLEKEQSDGEIKVLQRQLDAQRSNLDKNTKRRGQATSENDRETFDQAITADLQRIYELETEITKQQRNQVDQTRTLAIESARVTQAIEEQLAALDEQIALSKGFLTDDQIAASAARQVKAISDALARLGTPADEIMDRVADLTRLKTVEAQLGQLRQQYQLAADQLATAEQSVANARNAGSITAEEAEARILQLRREQLPVLDALLQRLRALATSPEQKAEIDKIAVNLDALRDLRTEFEKTAQQQVSEAGTSIFKGLVTQSESAVDLVRNALRRMAEAALDLIAQQLGQQLAQSLFPQAIGAASGGGGGVASFLAALFHSGGVVGAGGGGLSRSVPLDAWALAPRFHTGGLIGDEVPIIAKKGEEVLTEDNPRHVRNYRGGIGSVSITTNVEAAGGDAAANQAAGEQLGQRVRAEVDAWALEQSRPGGILSGS